MWLTVLGQIILIKYNASYKQIKIFIILCNVRPVSTDVKDIDVSMVISCQEGVSCGVKGHMEETHHLGLLSSADHCH